MIRSFHIEGFKSLASLDMELGRVTVLVGENGCGKSNLLEAIALTAAASVGKLDHEYLSARGIRTTDARFMLSAFDDPAPTHVTLSVANTEQRSATLSLACVPRPGGHVWRELADSHTAYIESMIAHLSGELSLFVDGEFPMRFAQALRWGGVHASLDEFLIFSPENTALRTFQSEGQVLPLGIRGEGLFALLKSLRGTDEGRAALDEINRQLTLLDWFHELRLDDDLAPGERTLRIGDRYLTSASLFDQRSANEGFLLLLFYFTLCISPGTPSFFAIDNLDASLNPRLCEELMRRLVVLAKRYDKQILVTTHNAAVLDGLDLADDEQRLLVVHRNRRGHTKVRRIENPTPAEGSPPVRLSEAFVRGYLGGLPKNF